MSEEEIERLPQAQNVEIYGPSNRRRGRPRKSDGEIFKWDIRLTPCDGEKIDFTVADLGQVKLLIGEEGGTPTLKLHYHIYLETRMSDTLLRQNLYKLAKWTPHFPSGNSVFRKGAPHEGTEGYAIKGENIVCSYGYTEQQLHSIVESSRQYRRDLESSKKAKSRASQATMREFIKEAVEHEEVVASPNSIVIFLLSKYEEHQMVFPSRSQIENATMTVMSRKGRMNYVIDYYTKNL